MMQKSAALFIPDKSTLHDVFMKDKTFADPRQAAITSDADNDIDKLKKAEKRPEQQTFQFRSKKRDPYTYIKITEGVRVGRYRIETKRKDSLVKIEQPVTKGKLKTFITPSCLLVDNSKSCDYDARKQINELSEKMGMTKAQLQMANSATEGKAWKATKTMIMGAVYKTMAKARSMRT